MCWKIIDCSYVGFDYVSTLERKQEAHGKIVDIITTNVNQLESFIDTVVWFYNAQKMYKYQKWHLLLYTNDVLLQQQ